MTKDAQKEKPGGAQKSISSDQMERYRADDYRTVYSNLAEVNCTPFEIRINFYDTDFRNAEKLEPRLKQITSVSLPIAVAMSLRNAIDSQLQFWQGNYQEVYKAPLKEE